MANYVYLNRYNSTGNLALSKRVFLSLGEHALINAKKIFEQKQEENVEIKDTIKVDLKDDLVAYRFYVETKNGVDNEAIKENIHDIITTSLMMVCDVIPFDIDIKVRTIQ